jgi:hypothetical protein
VSQESNNGPNAAPAPPGLQFGLDMPIVDPGSGGIGDPGNSWLLYKVLLAAPSSGPSVAPFPGWQPLSDGERAVLGQFLPGREMPFPTAGDSGIPLPSPSLADGLTTQQMQTLSQWIAQGAVVPPNCAASAIVDAGGGG